MRHRAKTILFLICLVVLSMAIATVSSADKVPKCSKRLCQDVGCAADFYCASGATVKSCAPRSADTSRLRLSPPLTRTLHERGAVGRGARSFPRSGCDRDQVRLCARSQGRTGLECPRQPAGAHQLAVHWSRIDDVLEKAGDLSGRVVVTCSLPMDARNTKLIIGNTSSGAEELAKKIRNARVVSAFNTVPSEVLVGVFEAKRRKNRPSLRDRRVFGPAL